MRSNSDHYPEQTIKSNGKIQINFNILKVSREEMDGTTRTSYDFDYVEVSGEVTRAKIIDAIISSVLTKDAEIAMINNELAAAGTSEYAAYQELRAKAKEVADMVLKEPL